MHDELITTTYDISGMILKIINFNTNGVTYTNV